MRLKNNVIQFLSANPEGRIIEVLLYKIKVEITYFVL